MKEQTWVICVRGGGGGILKRQGFGTEPHTAAQHYQKRSELYGQSDFKQALTNTKAVVYWWDKACWHKSQQQQPATLSISNSYQGCDAVMCLCHISALFPRALSQSLLDKCKHTVNILTSHHIHPHTHKHTHTHTHTCAHISNRNDILWHRNLLECPHCIVCMSAALQCTEV